jgi:hypothetical protein
MYCVLLLLLLDLATAAETDAQYALSKCRLAAVASVALLIGSILHSDSDDDVPRTRGPRDRPRNRVRRSMGSIFREHGPYYVRRAYRMTEQSFWELHELLKPYLVSNRRRPGSAVKKHRNGSKNGLIPSETRLAAAIRYFAGGRPDDIAISHGIGHSEVFFSVWKVVDAVNKCPALDFEFPSSHAKQRELAKAFEANSQAGFDCCVGAVDGILIWIERPSSAVCDQAGCGPKKFFCGRKHKFGLNMQGTCDAEGKFMDVCIGHPASTSDFLAFATSKFHKQIETPGFLAPGLCIFGDNAYVNNAYFITPYKNVKEGVRDAFNFYQSQLRIKIECAFGMLVARWGILRRALPQAMGLKKVTALVICLCRLHNYCLRQRGSNNKILSSLTPDALEIMAHGGVAATEDNYIAAEELLNGGEHHDDTSKVFRQNFSRSGSTGVNHLPRDRLLEVIQNNDFKRPTPKSWSKTGQV